MPADDHARLDYPVIDFAAHFLPDRSPTGIFREIMDEEGPIFNDITAANERFEAGGVDGAVLSWNRRFGSDSISECREANDTLLDIIDADDHYYGLAALPTGVSGDAATAEFERCLANGYHGGAIQTETKGVAIHDEELTPLLEVADRTGAPLMVHPKINDSLGEGVLDDTYLLNTIFGREWAIAEQVFRAVHMGVFDRYDDLSLVFHHTGGNIASMMGRIWGRLSKEDLPATLKSYDEFRAQLHDRVYIDCSGYYGDPTAFRAAIEHFSATNILFGSDFPFETRTGQDFARIIEGINTVATPADARRILGQNALDLLVNT